MSVPNIDVMAQEYAACFRGLRRIMARYRHRISPMGLLVNYVPEGGSVLDIGCGHALFPYFLWRSGKSTHITGIELDQDTVNEANLALSMRRTGKDITLIQADSATQWPQGPYDTVCMIDVMHHIPPALQESSFNEMAKRVKPGGILLYKDMCKKPMWRALANRLHDLLLARQIIHYVPIDTVDQWAAARNLHREKAFTVPMLWYGHEGRIYRKDIA